MANFQNLVTWFQQHKRPLPWRDNPAPYAVWISEVMLQQTQASVVIPYFERWMRCYPTTESLARAPLSEILKLWEGLGYYSRARNLHAAANYFLKYHQGRIPDNYDALNKVKGLGDYTINAILAFAFHQKRAAVDGNVLRVLSRLFMIEEEISRSRTVKNLKALATSLLPEKEPWLTSEALIELGACICKRDPLCDRCPIKSECKSHAHGVAKSLPVKPKREKTAHLYREVVILHADGKFCVTQRKKGEVMADLFEFPYFDTDDRGMKINELEKAIHERFSLQVQPITTLNEITHSFTRYRAHLKPTLFHCDPGKNVEKHRWLSKAQLLRRPFSSGHRQILSKLMTLDIDHARSSH